MRKKIFGRHFSRDTGARKALFRSLVRSLVLYGKIKTTKAKAKSVQSEVDKLVNEAKRKTVDARRRVLAWTGNDIEVTELLCNRIAGAFQDLSGGVTRIVNLPPRRGDLAPMVRFEWTKQVIEADKSKVTEKDKEKKMVVKAKVVKKEAESKVGKKRASKSKTK